MWPFTDFTKLDIRIATVLECRRVPETDKLLVMVVDLGSAKKQLVAGIGKKYQPEELIGHQLPVVVNIEPTTIRGEKSEGILMAVDTGSEPVLLRPEKKVPDGSQVR
jgi:methionyl-tRNA synthetase